MRSIYVGLLFFFIACHFPPAVEVYAAETSPLAATGLLVHPGETAGEILLRAHQFDIEAMALTVLGYSRGVGGFPKEPLLAAEWVTMVDSLGAFEVGFFVQLLYWEDRAADGTERISETIRSDYCIPLRENALVSRFQQAGLFDADRICGRSGQGEDSQLTTKLAISSREKATQTQEIMHLVRELRSRQATLSDLKRLEGFSGNLLLFFAATTHNPAMEHPNWSVESLLDFMNAQRAHMPFIFSSEPPTEISSLMEPTLRRISRVIMKRQGEAPVRTLPTIDRAHRGEMAAVNSMVRYYQEGSFGFIEGELVEPWMSYAALRGDALNQLMLAVREFESKKLTRARAWAKLALASKDDGVHRLAVDLMTRIEARSKELNQKNSDEYFEDLQKEIRRREEWQAGVKMNKLAMKSSQK